MSIVPRRVSISSQDRPLRRTTELHTVMKPFPISTATHNTNDLNDDWTAWEKDTDSQSHQPNGAVGGIFDNRGVVGMVPGTLQLSGDNAMSSAGQEFHRAGLQTPHLPMSASFPQVPQGPVPPLHPFHHPPRGSFTSHPSTFPVPLVISTTQHPVGNYLSSPMQTTSDTFARGIPVEDESSPFHPRSPTIPPPGHLVPYNGFPFAEFSSYYVPSPEGHFSGYPRPHSHPQYALPHLVNQGHSRQYQSHPHHFNPHGTHPSAAQFTAPYPLTPGPPPPLFFYGPPAPTHLSPPMPTPTLSHFPSAGSLDHNGNFRDTSPQRRGNELRQTHIPSTSGRNNNRSSYNRLTSMSDGPRSGLRRPYEDKLSDPSPLLVKFRSDLVTLGTGNALATWNVKDLRNHISEFSADQHGSRLIQSQLNATNVEDRDWIFDEIVPKHFDSLMLNVFGNYVIQKLFEHGSETQKQVLVSSLEKRVVEFSFNIYACRVVQAALDHITPTQQSILIARLHDHVLRCIRDAQGNHVIQKLIETVDPRRLTFLQTICDNIRSLSSHAYGCRVLQRCLAYLGDDHVSGIMAAIHRHTLDSVQDQFGNYVIQYIITSGKEADKERVINKISENLMKLSQQKFASNVCEKALLEASPDGKRKLIDRVLNGQINGQPATTFMIKHQYANYVLQTAIRLAEGDQLKLLLERVHPIVVELRKATTGHNKPLDNVEKITLERLAQQPPIPAEALPSSEVVTIEDTDKE